MLQLLSPATPAHAPPAAAQSHFLFLTSTHPYKNQNIPYVQGKYMHEANDTRRVPDPPPPPPQVFQLRKIDALRSMHTAHFAHLYIYIYIYIYLIYKGPPL